MNYCPLESPENTKLIWSYEPAPTQEILFTIIIEPLTKPKGVIFWCHGYCSSITAGVFGILIPYFIVCVCVCVAQLFAFFRSLFFLFLLCLTVCSFNNSQPKLKNTDKNKRKQKTLKNTKKKRMQIMAEIVAKCGQNVK